MYIRYIFMCVCVCSLIIDFIFLKDGRLFFFNFTSGLLVCFLYLFLKCFLLYVYRLFTIFFYVTVIISS